MKLSGSAIRDFHRTLQNRNTNSARIFPHDKINAHRKLRVRNFLEKRKEKKSVAQVEKGFQREFYEKHKTDWESKLLSTSKETSFRIAEERLIERFAHAESVNGQVLLASAHLTIAIVIS